MKTVIMAGGKGTRISSITTDIPKPMIKINGKPVLEYEIECLREQGFNDIIITVSHLAEHIISYFGNGEKFGVKIEYYVEETPLGNAGALFKLKDKLKEDFLLLNADAMFNIDFKRFERFHKEKNAIVSLFTHPNSHPYDSGLIIADSEGRVTQWLAKEDNRPVWYKNRVNAGVHIINPKALDKFDAEVIGTEVDGKIIKVDLDRDVLKPLCNQGVMYCYDSPEYVKDMGTPDRYQQVCNDCINGVITAKNLREKQKAIFLDRDGTINKYVGFLNNIDDVELITGVAEAIRRINNAGYLAIIVTNQPVVARGEVTLEQLNEIHNKLETLLGREGAYVDAIYYCPHHPHKGYAGEVKELKIDCECRKPKPGMILQAMKDYNIDAEQSWMIGDSQNDILAGNASGCKTALVGTEDFGQCMNVKSILEFVNRLGI